MELLFDYEIFPFRAAVTSPLHESGLSYCLAFGHANTGLALFIHEKLAQQLFAFHREVDRSGSLDRDFYLCRAFL